MAKKKPRPTADVPTVEELAQLAEDLGLDPDALHDDLRDSCDDEADRMFDNIKREDREGQIRFLVNSGFMKARIAERLQELKAEQDAEGH